MNRSVLSCTHACPIDLPDRSVTMRRAARPGPSVHFAFGLAFRLAFVLAFAFGTTGCGSRPFAFRPVSRGEAIANCIDETPAEAVPYGDLFAACMERQGYVYSGNAS